LHQIAHVGRQKNAALSYLAVKLFSKYSISMITAPKRYGQTDRQTTCSLITALCVASRGNNINKMPCYRRENRAMPL